MAPAEIRRIAAGVGTFDRRVESGVGRDTIEVMTTFVTNNEAAARYEIHDDGELAGFLTYRLAGNVADLTHIETLPAFAGRGMAATLVAGALDDVRRRGLSIVPSCPYVSSYLDRHPDQRDLLPPRE
jgi:predicted GNAT family acetyltransferase